MSRGPGVVQRAVLTCASVRTVEEEFDVDDVLLGLHRWTGPDRGILGTHAERESVLRAMRKLASAGLIKLQTDGNGRIVAATGVTDRPIAGTRVEWERSIYRRGVVISTRPMAGEVIGVLCPFTQRVEIVSDPGPRGGKRLLCRLYVSQLSVAS
jgi:hypothetical protein